MAEVDHSVSSAGSYFRMAQTAPSFPGDFDDMEMNELGQCLRQRLQDRLTTRDSKMSLNNLPLFVEQNGLCESSQAQTPISPATALRVSVTPPRSPSPFSLHSSERCSIGRDLSAAPTPTPGTGAPTLSFVVCPANDRAVMAQSRSNAPRAEVTVTSWSFNGQPSVDAKLATTLTETPKKRARTKKETPKKEVPVSLASQIIKSVALAPKPNSEPGVRGGAPDAPKRCKPAQPRKPRKSRSKACEVIPTAIEVLIDNHHVESIEEAPIVVPRPSEDAAKIAASMGRVSRRCSQQLELIRRLCDARVAAWAQAEALRRAVTTTLDMRQGHGRAKKRLVTTVQLCGAVDAAENEAEETVAAAVAVIDWGTIPASEEDIERVRGYVRMSLLAVAAPD
eukprot:CAMPEP_0114554468 /NCGR_PEP_ID=MMETSP0114-20121206/8227_1 /TAXON_ID=31324 /ORGANISM="Goniomonas sp, Strain m" /LENGTH=393 /DNA_ID=CAMNT_0001739519 /DNA_START=59 /DNA_END=1240 /DNA_ORIENTATION=-